MGSPRLHLHIWQTTERLGERHTVLMSRLLIVDDSQATLTFLQVIFESEQYEVMTASNGIDGLAKVHQARPDVIITDSVMPELDGFGLLRALRDDPATEGIPVIMLTSGDPHDPEFADREPRPTAFVKKSANFGPLLTEVRDALGRRS
jgi:CheY-like chemotaxis protein